jgi:hypothetical protein
MTVNDIPKIHQLYCALTGMQIRLDMAREHEWYHWIKRGFEERDLRDLVAFLRTEIRAGRRNPGALKFRNLIVNLDYFEEDLAEARATARQPKIDRGRAEALRATGRPAAPPTPPARDAGAIAQHIATDPAAASKAFEDFKRFKESL